MNFIWATLKVKSLQESLCFYHEKMKLPLVRKFTTPDGTQIAFLGEEAETQLELLQASEGTDIVVGNGVTLGFSVENAEEMAQTLTSVTGGRITGPVSPGGGNVFYFVNDPDGYGVQLVQRG